MSDKRRHPRIRLNGATVHITDGCFCTSALIDNVSSRGICLCCVPEQLYRSAEYLTVFSTSNPAMPTLHLQPRWQRLGWKGKTIGAAILDAPETWQFFIGRATGLRRNEATAWSGRSRQG